MNSQKCDVFHSFSVINISGCLVLARTLILSHTPINSCSYSECRPEFSLSCSLIMARTKMIKCAQINQIVGRKKKTTAGIVKLLLTTKGIKVLFAVCNQVFSHHNDVPHRSSIMFLVRNRELSHSDVRFSVRMA